VYDVITESVHNAHNINGRHVPRGITGWFVKHFDVRRQFNTLPLVVDDCCAFRPVVCTDGYADIDINRLGILRETDLAPGTDVAHSSLRVWPASAWGTACDGMLSAVAHDIESWRQLATLHPGTNHVFAIIMDAPGAKDVHDAIVKAGGVQVLTLPKHHGVVAYAAGFPSRPAHKDTTSNNPNKAPKRHDGVRTHEYSFTSSSPTESRQYRPGTYHDFGTAPKHIALACPHEIRWYVVAANPTSVLDTITDDDIRQLAVLIVSEGGPIPTTSTDTPTWRALDPLHRRHLGLYQLPPVGGDDPALVGSRHHGDAHSDWDRGSHNATAPRPGNVTHATCKLLKTGGCNAAETEHATSEIVLNDLRCVLAMEKDRRHQFGQLLSNAGITLDTRDVIPPSSPTSVATAANSNTISYNTCAYEAHDDAKRPCFGRVTTTLHRHPDTQNAAAPLTLCLLCYLRAVLEIPTLSVTAPTAPTLERRRSERAEAMATSAAEAAAKAAVEAVAKAATVPRGDRPEVPQTALADLLRRVLRHPAGVDGVVMSRSKTRVPADIRAQYIGNIVQFTQKDGSVQCLQVYSVSTVIRRFGPSSLFPIDVWTVQERHPTSGRLEGERYECSWSVLGRYEAIKATAVVQTKDCLHFKFKCLPDGRFVSRSDSRLPFLLGFSMVCRSTNGTDGTVRWQHDHVFVTKVVKGSPAEAAGLKKGMRIAGVHDRAVPALVAGANTVCDFVRSNAFGSALNKATVHLWVTN
jgi:hypothetical protein